MKKNKITSYLLYAIGEIVLVVIGILIAVSLNNLNESRKSNELEKQILSEISIDLEDGIASLENDIRLNNDLMKSIDVIKRVITSNQNFTDSLSTYFGKLIFNTTITVNTSGYDYLKNEGFHIIKNQSLRKHITSFYESGYQFLKSYEASDLDITQKFFIPKYLHYFKDIDSVSPKSFRGKFYPKNMNDLREDAEFTKLLDFLKLKKKEIIFNIEISMKQMQQLKIAVDEYRSNL